MAKQSSNISGESIALAFVSVGLLFSYLWGDVYGVATQYVGALIALLGVVGFLVEMEKRFRNQKLRIGNGGVGLLLLGPTLYGCLVVYGIWDGWLRIIVMTFLGFWLIFGFAGVYDFIISVLENSRKTTTKKAVIEALKFLSIVATTSVAIIAALRQLFV